MCSLLIIPVLFAIISFSIFLFYKRHFIYALGLLILAFYLNASFEIIGVNIIKDNAKKCSHIMRITTYNLDVKYGHYENLENWRSIVHFIDSINPDVFLPQEYSYYGGDSLRIALNDRYPYNTKLFFGDGYYLTDMVFSRYPIVKLDYLLGFGKTIYEMDINVDGKVVKVVNCHLHSNNFTSEVESGEHNFLQKLKEGYNERAKEVDDIVDSLKSYNNAPLIVCGDMNDVSGSYTIRTLQDSLKLNDAWWQGGTGFGFTYHGYGVMRFRLDHILYNKYLELQSVSVPHVGFSDHWPVVADFIIQ